MDELSRLMAQSMGQRLGADIKSCMAESRAGFRRAAANDKPPNKRPHSFDADAAHTFDKFAEHASSLGFDPLVDMLTDAIARGKLTEIQAHAQLWPSVAYATQAGDQYTFEHPWRTRKPRLNDAMARYDEFGKFSLARQLEVLVNPRWEALKDRGNDALKAGEPAVATIWYKRAESLTDNNNAVTAFFKVVGTLGGAGARLAGSKEDLRALLLSFLPDGPRAIVPFDDEAARRSAELGEDNEGTEPNLPRAICLSNAAAALLKAGKPKDALEEVLDAVAICPEYVKAHHRLVSCWRAVGKVSEAADLEKQLGMLKWMREQMAWVGLNLVCVGWIGTLAYEQIYGPAYFKHECAKIAEIKKKVTVLASLVPVGDAQWLTVGVEYRSLGVSMMEGGPPERRHDCMHMVQLDHENGGIVQSPPHGRASKKAIERFPRAILGFLRKLRGEAIEPEHLCLGQGLTIFERSMKKQLKAKGFGAMTTNVATVTHASKVQEMGEAAACGF